MNLNELNPDNKQLATKSIFKTEGAQTIAITLKKGGQLSKHMTKTEALLLCVSGEAKFGNENGVEETLTTGSYVHIEANVIHWVDGLADAQLVLVK
jgi:quercetin dioxygenase-like cupin family protein